MSRQQADDERGVKLSAVGEIVQAMTAELDEEILLTQAEVVIAAEKMRIATEEIADRDPVLAPFLAFSLPSYDGPR